MRENEPFVLTPMPLDSRTPMTAEEFTAIWRATGLSMRHFGRAIRVADASTIAKWMNGSRQISGPVSIIMEMVRDGKIIIERNLP